MKMRNPQHKYGIPCFGPEKEETRDLFVLVKLPVGSGTAVVKFFEGVPKMLPAVVAAGKSDIGNGHGAVGQ